MLEVNYIGRQGRNLFGGYDANQVDISNNGFLADFQQLQDPRDQAERCNQPEFSINQLMAGDSRLGTGQTGSQFLIGSRLGRAWAGPSRERTDHHEHRGRRQRRAGGVCSCAGYASRRQHHDANFQLNGFSPFFFQPYPQFTGAVNVIDSNDRSRYNALEIQLSRRFNRGFGFQVSYTLAKSEDTRSFDPAFAVANRGFGQSAANTPYDIQ